MRLSYKNENLVEEMEAPLTHKQNFLKMYLEIGKISNRKNIIKI